MGLAEFLAADPKQPILVLDLDAQASSSGALLGRPALTGAIKDNRTVAALAHRLLAEKVPFPGISEWLTLRPAAEGRGTALAEIDVLAPDKPVMIEL